ncbi:MAG: ParM/StbA family protein [Clostridia bacterium]|nr:ParM/StbA family protein [Clostridia bacterium]
MNTNILTVGADLGNDAFKIIGPTKRELFIMNILSPWHERRVVNEDTRYPLNLLEVEVKSKNENLGRYFVGGMAYNFNRGILKERTVADRHNGKANDNETLIILLTSIALSLLKPNTRVIKEKVVLGTMLPTEEFFKNQKEHVALLESKLKGIHRIKFLNPVFNEAEVEFEIVGVSTQPEGLCAMNAIMYDDEGNLLSHYESNYSERTILGFDIGALTSDVTVVHNFDLRTFFGIDKGTIDPLNRIIDYIKTEYKATVSRHKLDNAIIRNEKLLIYGNEIPNLHQICKEFIDHEARQLVDEFSSKSAAAGIQLPDIGLLILCGGGSLLFKEVIQKNLGRIPMIFSDNAIMLNAIGAWKNANRLKNQSLENSAFDYAAASQS